MNKRSRKSMVDFLTGHTRHSIGNGYQSSIDAERDFADWSIADLRVRERTVEAFDSACDAIRDQFIFLLQSCEVMVETVMVPKTVKHLSCACNA